MPFVFHIHLTNRVDVLSLLRGIVFLGKTPFSRMDFFKDLRFEDLSSQTRFTTLVMSNSGCPTIHRINTISLTTKANMNRFEMINGGVLDFEHALIIPIGYLISLLCIKIFANIASKV